MSTLNVDKVDPSTGTALELGTSGDTITVPTGAGLTVTDEVKTNKVSPATGTAFALGDSGDTFTVPSGATIVNSGTATGFGITAASFRPNVQPLIINGDMQVAQRGTSTASISTSGYYTTDRWYYHLGSTSGVVTETQESLTSGDAFTDGFSKSFKLDVTTADASLAAGDFANIRYRIEGQDLQLFKKGTANAETYTISFWIKATKTGANICELYDHSNSRICSQEYTVSSTDTWEYKVVNFPADTTGAIANTNAVGLGIRWWIAAGSTYSGGTLATTWASAVAANEAVGQVNNLDSTSNNFEITGVQLEVGEYTSSTIPPFQHESFADNWRRCSRYYTKWLSDTPSGGTGGGPGYTCGGQASGTAAVIHIFLPLPVPLRAAPSIANNPNGIYLDYDTGTAVTSGTWTVRANQPYTMSCIIMGIDGCANLVDNTLASARPYGGDLTFNAEL